MIKKVRIKDKPMITWLGGMVGVPMALRNIDRTITILVKDVAKMITEGANDKTVTSTKSCTPLTTSEELPFY